MGKILNFFKNLFTIEDNITQGLVVTGNEPLLYLPNYRDVVIKTLHPDIASYVTRLQDLLDLINEKSTDVLIQKISEDDKYTKTLSEWYTNEEYLLDDNNTRVRWIALSTEFIVWYDRVMKYQQGAKTVYQARRLSPYYNDVKTIIETIKQVKKTTYV